PEWNPGTQAHARMMAEALRDRRLLAVKAAAGNQDEKPSAARASKKASSRYDERRGAPPGHGPGPGAAHDRRDGPRPAAGRAQWQRLHQCDAGGGPGPGRPADRGVGPAPV